MSDATKQSVYDTLVELLQKNEFVRVNLQPPNGQRAEGTMTQLELADVLGGDKTVRIHYDSIALDVTPPPLEFSIAEIEHHSSLRKAQYGWTLTVNRQPRK